MPNQLVFNGSSYVTAAAPGNVLSSTVLYQIENFQLTTGATNYITCIGGSTQGNRELAWFIKGDGDLALYAGGSENTIGSAATLLGDQPIALLELSSNAGAYSVVVDGTTVASGDPIYGTGRVEGMLQRFGARSDTDTSGTGGAFFLPDGCRMGDVTMTIDAGTPKVYAMPASGTTIPPDGTLRGGTGDGSDWETIAAPVPAPPAGYAQVVYDGTGDTLTGTNQQTIYEELLADAAVSNYEMLVGDVIEHQIVAGVTIRENSSVFLSPSGTYVVQLRIYRVATSDYTAYTTATFESTATVDVTANSFTLNDVTGAEPNTLTATNDVTVLGLGSGVSIVATIIDGQFAVSTDGGSTFGAVSAANQNVENGYVIRVYGLSLGFGATNEGTTLFYGDQSDTFTVTTRADSTLSISPQTFTVSEDIAIGQAFARVVAPNATSFTVPAGIIDIDNAGDLTVNTALDYSTTQSYAISVTATNGGGSETATITINVTEVVGSLLPAFVSAVPDFNIEIGDDVYIDLTQYTVNATTFSINAGTLPTGLSLSSAGLITGIATTAGTFENIVFEAV